MLAVLVKPDTVLHFDDTVPDWTAAIEAKNGESYIGSHECEPLASDSEAWVTLWCWWHGEGWIVDWYLSTWLSPDTGIGFSIYFCPKCGADLYAMTTDRNTDRAVSWDGTAPEALTPPLRCPLPSAAPDKG